MKKAARLTKISHVGFFLTLLVLAAALPRLIGVCYGLPQVYNADEPHVVNMAVSLAKSLRPYSFKYPTLWPTFLAACYGLWFMLWSGFGFLRGTLDFTALYAFNPSGFYLIARFMASVCQILALILIAREEMSGREKNWPFGALILAFSPVLVELAHASKPDSFMFLLCSATTIAALRHQKGGERFWLLLSAFLGGLAISAQYTALPAGLVVPLSWLLCDKGPGPISWLLQAGLMSVLGFALGTPFAFLEWDRFVDNWKDYAELGRLKPHDAAMTAKQVLINFWTFGGGFSLAGLMALIGFGAFLKQNSKKAFMLIIPVTVYAMILSASYDGVNARYGLGAYPSLALLAGIGLSTISGIRGGYKWRKILLLLLLLVPGLYSTVKEDEQFVLNDTRALASAWLSREVEAGSTLLLDQVHAGPAALMSKEQCEELYQRTLQHSSPRARLFQAMALRHPGGGYRIYRIQRSAKDLWSGPHHVELSQADGDFLDVRPGLDVARAARVDLVMSSSFGVDPKRTPELATFFSELETQAELVAEFYPKPGEVVGPVIKFYSVRK